MTLLLLFVGFYIYFILELGKINPEKWNVIENFITLHQRKSDCRVTKDNGFEACNVMNDGPDFCALLKAP